MQVYGFKVSIGDEDFDSDILITQDFGEGEGIIMLSYKEALWLSEWIINEASKEIKK